MNSQLLLTETQNFIKENLNRNPSEILLKSTQFPKEVLREIVIQIQSKQKAKNKLPTWFDMEDILFPKPLSIEQSSSEKTAAWKAKQFSGKAMIDLTGGFGVDSFYFVQTFEKVYYIEFQVDLQKIVQHNFEKLGVKNCKFINQTAEEFVNKFSEQVDLIYLDPARRDEQNQKLTYLEDCQPAILNLLPQLWKVTDTILLKTSPLLDISEAIQQLQKVTEVWVVALQNEVKEVLYLLKSNITNQVKISTVELSKQTEKKKLFSFYQNEEKEAEVTYSLPQNYLYEPNTALLKAGAFRLVSEKYKIQKLHINSHLYTSEKLVSDFLGRTFEIQAVTSYQKKEIKKHLQDNKANITTRNFPEKVVQIRKKLGLKEGGDIYLFATTNLANQKVIIICQKVNKE